MCGGELYGSEQVYCLDDELICEDCLTDYARERFADALGGVSEWLGLDEMGGIRH